MSTGTESTGSSKVCPYCGERVGAEDACAACKGLQEPLSRQASQNAMGPWFIRDATQPFRPGCSIETVRMLVSRGKVTGETILRGPTTSQFWRAASRVPGVSHLLGVCYSCRAKVSATDAECPACAASFAAPEDRQHLGLGPVRLLPGQASAAVVAEQAIAGGSGAKASGKKERVKEKSGGREGRVEETYEPLLAPATGALSVAPVAIAEEKAPGMSSVERAARLARVEAEARAILREQRERAQGRVRAIGVGIGLLLLLVLGVALTIASSIGGGRGGGARGGGGAGGAAGSGVAAPAPASTAPAAATP